MHGQVVPSKKEESSILHLWKLNYPVTINLTIHQKNFYSMNKKKKNGRKWMKRTDLSILFLEPSIRWGIFHFMTGWSNKDFKDVWICICAQESKRKNLTLILILWFLNYQIQKLLNHSPLQLTSHIIVIRIQLVQFQFHRVVNIFALETKVVWL